MSLPPPFVVNGSGLAQRAAVTAGDAVQLELIFSEGTLRRHVAGDLVWSDDFTRSSWERLVSAGRLGVDGQTRAVGRLYVDGSGVCPSLNVKGAIGSDGMRSAASPITLTTPRGTLATYAAGAEVNSAWVLRVDWLRAVADGTLA